MIAELLNPHEGLPSWFPHLVFYILDCLKNRDRFNLYNATKALRRALPKQIIYTTDIREVLSLFEDYDLSFQGRHQQVIIPTSRLLDFWESFYLPAQSEKKWDISFFSHRLRQKRHQELTKDAFFRNHLPPNYKSLKKERLIVLFLRALFNFSSDYEVYASKKLPELSSQAQNMFEMLSSEPKAYSALLRKLGTGSNQALQELFESLLARPYYLRQDNVLRLYISVYAGHAEPFRVTDCMEGEPATLMQCLGPIYKQISANLNEGQFNKTEPILRFPWAQLQLMRQQCPEAQGIADLMVWWRDVPGFAPVDPGRLPLNFTFTKSARGSCGVLAIEGYQPRDFTAQAQDFELLRRDDSGRLILTCLGDWVGGGPEPQMGVRDVWGRNIERITLQLSSDWPPEFKDMLLSIAVFKKDKYLIRREDILERCVPLEQLLLILGSFVELNAKRRMRLQSWFSNAPLPNILQASAVPFEEVPDKKALQKIGKIVLESGGHYIVVGLSPAQLKRSIQEHWKK